MAVCSRRKCRQPVLNKKERESSKPLCYYHAKRRDGLIGPSSEYSLIGENTEDIWERWERIDLNLTPENLHKILNL